MGLTAPNAVKNCSQQRVVLTGFGGGLTWGSLLLTL
ncbi:hypothetical protein DSM21_09310 [Enterococcus faecalis]|nr:hypothetical protein [Enterococcus faecalis]